jgi:hypothetical protein
VKRKLKPPQSKPPEETAEHLGLRAARLGAIAAYWAEGKPIKWFKEYNPQDLIDAGIPKSDLARAGIIKTADGEAQHDLSKPVTLRKCALIMGDIYGHTIDPMRLTRAFQRGAPGRYINGLIVPARLLAWWNENEKEANDKSGVMFDELRKVELQRKTAEARKATAEADEIERANDNKWMLVEYHNATLQKAGGVAWARFCAIIEKELPMAHDAKLRQLNVTPELLTAIMTHIRTSHLAAADSLQKEMEKLV